MIYTYKCILLLKKFKTKCIDTLRYINKISKLFSITIKFRNIF